MQTRIAKYGQFISTIGENIAYGTTGGRAIVLALIIDDGVPNRGHRSNIFNPSFLFLGAYTGPHTTYTSETVIDYAGGLTSNGQHALTPATDPNASSGSTTPA